jgi:YD repeat-containing protein
MQPDVFHYSFAGESGYFVFDNGQNIHLVPNKNWKITKTITNNKIVSFDITTDNGIIYKFGYNAIEETKLTTLQGSAYWNFSETTPVLTIDGDNFKEVSEIGDFYNSKWYLKEIISPLNDKITFDYDDAGLVSYVDAPQIMSYETMTGLQWDINPSYFGNTATLHPHLLAYSIIRPEIIESREFGLNSPCTSADLTQRYLNCNDCWIDEDGYYRAYSDNSYKPCIDQRDEAVIDYPLRYFMHQNKIETKSKILSYIRASNQDYIRFLHDNSTTIPGVCRINEIKLIDSKEREIKKYTLKYKKVVSNSADPSGAKSDPFSPFEFYAFRSAQIPKPVSGFVPANNAQSYFTSYTPPQQTLMNKYVIEGLETYNYERFFLEELQEKSGEISIPPYIFNYYSPESIIRRTSVWTGSLNYSRTDIPSQIIFKLVEADAYQVADGLPDSKLTRKPAGTSYGQLQKIILPTGGYVEYGWESINNFGNKRVKTITQSDGNKTKYKYFTYTNGYSAIVANSRDIPFYDVDKLLVYKMRISTSYELYDVDYTKGSPVGYKEVKVQNCYDPTDPKCLKGYEQYEFTGFSDVETITGLIDEHSAGLIFEYPQTTNYTAECRDFDAEWGDDPSPPQWEISMKLDKNFVQRKYMGFTSMDNVRGLMKRHAVYNESGLITETINKYIIQEYSKVTGLSGVSNNFGIVKQIGDNCIGPMCRNVWDTYIQVNHIAYVSNHYSTSVSLASTTEKYIDNNNRFITTIKEFTPHPISTILKPIEAKSYSIDASAQKYGDEQMTKYRYTNEFTINNDMKALFDKNIFIPIEVINYNNNKVVGDTVTKYFNSNGLILPNKSYALETNQALSNYVPALFLTNDMYTGCQLKVIYDEYDDKGNLLQYHPENGNYTSYLWAYNKSYPVAKIENSTYQNVEDALSNIGSSISDIETKSIGSSDETDLITIFNSLRINALMKDVIITSYTFDPLIGIRSETDPSGKTTYYEYDGLGRLILARDQDNNIVKTYDYHYKTE